MKELFNTIKDIAKQAKLAIVAGLVILTGSLGYILSIDMPMGGDIQTLEASKDKIITSIDVADEGGEYKKYFYSNGIKISALKDEVIEKRKPKERTFKRGDVYETEIYVEPIQYKVNDQWEEVKTATATKKVFDDVMKVTLLDKVKSLVLGQAIATTDEFADSLVSYSYRNASNETWAVLRAGDGTAKSTNITVGFLSGTTAWQRIYRGRVSFNTAALPDDAEISAAKIYLNYTGQLDQNANNNYGANIVSLSPSSNTVSANSDYENSGSTAFSTAILHGDMGAGLEEFALNASGIAHIKLTTYTHFAVRESEFDLAGVTPNHANSQSNTVSFDGTNTKLSVTYTVPDPPAPVTEDKAKFFQPIIFN
jgi:hypothetical protein